MKKESLEETVSEDKMSPAEWANPMLAYDEGVKEGFAYGYFEGILRALGMKLIPDEEERDKQLQSRIDHYTKDSAIAFLKDFIRGGERNTEVELDLIIQELKDDGEKIPTDAC